MKDEIMLDILQKIKLLITKDSLDVAKEYVQLEIDNLKGLTEQRCKNTHYYFYDYFCQHCSNLNCNSNKKGGGEKIGIN